ncbi:MAG: cob(I)yrinic acid a,c-diamide adenosyltransferase [Eubacteriales bacterium]|nr:cob(I)yrinic acid a,c-diamide adenosyltransferase [Eubacteriales bacterium]
MDQIYSILFGGQKEENVDKVEEKSAKCGCANLPDDTSGEGLLHLYCGDGKGKTTCCMGLLTRAAGSGKKVLLHQFLKDNESSERKLVEKFPGVKVIPSLALDKWTFQMNEEELRDLREKNDKILEDIVAQAASFDMIVMDEALYAIDKNLLSEDKVIEFIEKKPRHLEVVLSGRNPSERMQEHADYISEICKRKHPFDRGVSSRLGIEK